MKKTMFERLESVLGDDPNAIVSFQFKSGTVVEGRVTSNGSDGIISVVTLTRHPHRISLDEIESIERLY